MWVTPRFIYLHIYTSPRLQKSVYLGSLMLLFMYFYPQLHFVQLGGSWSVMPVQCHNLGLLKFLGNCKSDVMMKSWQTPLNKTPSKRGKERTKRTQIWVRTAKPKAGHSGAKEQIMFQKPHQSQETFQKEKGEKHEGGISQQEFSLATTTCLKIKVA